MPESEYRDAKGRNYSRLKWALESGTKYQNPPQPKSVAVNIGRAVAAAFEDGLDFDARFVVWPKQRRGKEWQTFQEEHAGAEIVTLTEMQTIRRIVDAVDRHAEASAIINRSQREVAVFGELEGHQCKARIDLLDGDGSLYDLKTCASAKPSKWPAYAFNLGYDIQAAFYSDLVHSVTGTYPDWAWIAVENGDSPDVQIIEPSEIFVDVGRGRYREALRRIDEWKRSGVYPGYAPGRITVEPPMWAEHWSQIASAVTEMVGNYDD